MGGNQSCPAASSSGIRGTATSTCSPARRPLDAGVADPAVGSLDLEGTRAHPGRMRRRRRDTRHRRLRERRPRRACRRPHPRRRLSSRRKPIFRVVSRQARTEKTRRRAGVRRSPRSGIISLTGSGVKLVRRNGARRRAAWSRCRSSPGRSPGSRLAKFGKTKVRLKVIFDGQGGGFEEWSKAVVLRKKTPGRRATGRRGACV